MPEIWEKFQIFETLERDKQVPSKAPPPPPEPLITPGAAKKHMADQKQLKI